MSGMSTDPHTGKPVAICSPIVITATEPIAGTYARCRGCGQPVAVDRFGSWEYVSDKAA